MTTQNESRKLKKSQRQRKTSSNPCQPFLRSICRRSRTIEEVSWVR